MIDLLDIRCATPTWIAIQLAIRTAYFAAIARRTDAA